MKKMLLFFLMSLSCTFTVLAKDRNSESNLPSEGSMKIRITIGNTILAATMADNATVHDFISLMPLTLTMTDYNHIEKVSNLSRPLTTSEAPPGYDPSVGDITLYAPWENIAIFYGDYGYAHGLIFLGRIDSGIETFAVPGSLTVRFEVMP